MMGRIKKTQSEIRQEVREKSVGYILTALGLVAGLAWNEAIKALIDLLFPLGQDSIWAKFIYAGVITIAIVVATFVIIRFLGKKENE